MEWIRLIGIAIIVVGFILKFDTIATVVLAGLVTALVSGVSLVEFWRFWEKNLAISECSRFYGYLASCGAVRNLWTQATINRFDSKD